MKKMMGLGIMVALTACVLSIYGQQDPPATPQPPGQGGRGQGGGRGGRGGTSRREEGGVGVGRHAQRDRTA